MFIVLALLAGAATVGLATWIVASALTVAAAPQVRGRRPPLRPVGPEDDAEFLTALRRRIRRGRSPS